MSARVRIESFHSMKTCSSLRTFAWLLAVCLVLTTPVVAQQPQEPDNFKILGVRTYNSNDLIKIGNAWRKDQPKRIQATLRVETDTPANTIFVKAYFYDRDYHLISTAAKPNPIWTSTGRGIEEVGLPATLAHVKNTDVYFAIPDDAQKKNWTTVLVVFGNKTTVAASANPATAITKLDFPEKASLAATAPGL